ncbi:MAG: hypothetical protein KAT00_01435 [Planctomycetes bacterium]|nr:hypothetical protein [Planctomycetota bacterium]
MTQQKTFLSFGLLLLLPLAAMLLTLFTPSNTAVVYQQQAATDWLSGQHANVQPGLRISPHALKHGQEAGDIYILLLTGGCVVSSTWCGGSDLEYLHTCMLASGLTGAILQFGDELTTGFWGKGDYWERRVVRENWEACQ